MSGYSVGRVVVLDWFDVFVFDRPEPTITCPDCDQISPELRDVWEAVKWADQHPTECPALDRYESGPGR